jgi:transcriptional regulator with XRE-family HTH domain
MNNLLAKDRLQERRKEKGHTQVQMAELLTLQTGKKVSMSLYQKIEQRRKKVSSPLAINIAEALESPVTELWEKSDDADSEE